MRYQLRLVDLDVGKLMYLSRAIANALGRDAELIQQSQIEIRQRRAIGKPYVPTALELSATTTSPRLIPIRSVG